VRTHLVYFVLFVAATLVAWESPAFAALTRTDKCVAMTDKPCLDVAPGGSATCNGAAKKDDCKGDCVKCDTTAKLNGKYCISVMEDIAHPRVCTTNGAAVTCGKKSPASAFCDWASVDMKCGCTYIGNEGDCSFTPCTDDHVP